MCTHELLQISKVAKLVYLCGYLQLHIIISGGTNFQQVIFEKIHHTNIVGITGNQQFGRNIKIEIPNGRVFLESI